MIAARVTLAAIAGAHGVGGAVRLKLFAQSVESLSRHRRVQVAERSLTVRSVRAAGGDAVAQFEEVRSRDEAEALRGLLLTVARDALPAIGDDEYYHADLIGLVCVAADGTALGRVRAVVNFGAGDLLEIERPDGTDVMAPFRAGIADRSGDTIVVDPAFLA